MAINLTKDHHLLTRNLKLNGNYISNDGENEGISIDDDGVVTASSQIDIGNMSLTTSELDISTGDFTLDVAGDIELNAAGQQLSIKASSSSFVDFDFAAGNVTMYPIGSTVDYLRFHVTTNGASIIETVDDGVGAAGTLTIRSDGQCTLDVQGAIILDSSSGVTKFYDAGDAYDYCSLTVDGSNGETTIATVDNAGGEVGHLTLAPDGDCIIDRNTALAVDGTAKGLWIDYDHEAGVGSGETLTGIGLDLDMNCDGGASNHGASVVNQTAIDIDMVASNEGIQSNVGIDIACSGSDNCTGLVIDVDGSGTIMGIMLDCKDGGKDFVNRSSANSSDYFMLTTIAAGATTLTTVDTSVGATTANLTLDIDGNIILDADGGDISFFDNETNRLRWTNSSGSWTMRNATSDADVIFNVNDGGANTEVMRLDGSASSLLIASGKKIEFGDAGEYISGDGTNLSIVSGGHVEFDGCGVGFDKETTTFAASAVLSEGDDSTDIDFRLGNKHELTLTDDIAGSGEYINMIFPATSGNFILVLIQGVADCTVNSTGWRAYQSDGSTLGINELAQNLPDGRVRWAGGSPPTLSTSQYDIDVVSFYWDADNGTALGVASLDFG